MDDEGYDLAKLPIGGQWVMCGKTYTVKKIKGWTITLDVDGKTVRMSPLSKAWDQFCRDIEGLIMSAHHGVDAGCLATLVDTIPEFPWDRIVRFRPGYGVKKEAEHGTDGS